MTDRDIEAVKALFPCIIKTVEQKHGGIVEDIVIYKAKGEPYHCVKLIVSRMLPFNVYLPSYIITPNREMMETVCLLINFGRCLDGSIYDKIFNIPVSNNDYRVNSFTSYRDRIEKAYDSWWKDVKCVMDAQAHVEKQVSLFKCELMERTGKYRINTPLWGY